MKKLKKKPEKKAKDVLIHPITTEKAVRLIEVENKITFAVDMRARKKDVKEELEKRFKVKVEKIGIHISKNKKIAYIKLKKETPAIEIATKLGMI
jgi:large subunit ribosomal protein L23